MLHKSYGKTGKQISVIGFGSMRFNQPEDIDANAEIVLHAYRRGVNYFDTAPYYCKDKSEDIIGTAVRQMQPGTFYLSTKSSAADGGKLREELERSLKRLGVPRIHFYHIWCVITHEQWLQRKQGGAVAAALKAREEGLIEHLAISSHLRGPELEKVLAEGFFEGATLGYSAINFPLRQQAVDAAGKMNLGVVTMNPLAGGLIPKNAERFDFIRQVNDESVVAAALRFNVSQPAVTCALVGFSSLAHVDEACDAMENFTPYDVARAERLRHRLQDSFGDICTGCGYCLPCPEGLEIPRLMDAYNHKILGGENMKLRLQWHAGVKPEVAQACSLCGQCEERCTQHLPIRQRLKEIAALADEPDKPQDSENGK